MKKIILLYFIFLTQCQTIQSYFSKDKEDASHGEDSSPKDKHYLDAQIWVKLESLEKKIKRNKEKISLIEKTLVEGIPIKESGLGLNDEEEDDVDENQLKKSKENKALALAEKKDDEDFAKALDAAKKIFEEGKVGQAYISFSRLEKDTLDNNQKIQLKYWQARCWFSLKDFETARKNFIESINIDSKSDTVPFSKLYLAQIEMNKGDKKTAVEMLKTLISTYPDHNAANDARGFLEKIKKDI